MSRLVLSGLFLAAALLAQRAELGDTTFANSGAPAAQADFREGLLLLHSFEYDDARDAFQRARGIDPDFAMAAWGEALTHQHPLWMELDLAAARAALESLAPTPEGRLAKAPTEREKGYMRAVEALFFRAKMRTPAKTRMPLRWRCCKRATPTIWMRRRSTPWRC